MCDDHASRHYAPFVQALRHLHGRGLDTNRTEAVRLLRLSSSKGFFLSFSHLGMCYLKGNGVAKDEEEAVRCFRQGAVMSCLKAEVELAKCIRDGIGTEKDEQKAFQQFKRLSKAGSTDAMVQLGESFLSGCGVYASLQTASRILRLAHLMGSCISTCSLGQNYLYEEGDVADNSAVQLYKRSVRDGHEEALFNLAKCYMNGTGMRKNITKAIRLLRRGTSLGNINCILCLGKVYEVGLGVDRDFVLAFRQYEIAHENECLAGTANLGVLYREGMGIPKDVDHANYLFRQAMEGGDGYGEACLGYSYFHGLGVEKDFAIAARHFENASDCGSSYGWLMLGLCYQTGCGVEQDVQKAFDFIDISRIFSECEQQAQCYRHLADCYWNGRGVFEDKDEAVDLYWKATEHDYRWPLSILASLYCQGDIEVESGRRKMRLLSHCIERGCVSCKVNLAKLLLSGDEVEEDTGRGCQLLEETVRDGHTTGMVQLGVYYLHLEDKRKEAFHLFEQASESDHEACIFVGFCLEHGFGVEQNSCEAIAWYQKGFGASEDVEKDSPAAAFALSYYCPEHGNPQDRKSKNLFTHAAVEGNEHGIARLGLRYRHGYIFFDEPDISEDCSPSEMLSIRLAHLGFMYRSGRGIRGDIEEGIRLLLMAEKKGNNFAGVEIGKVYSEGAGLQKDDISAVAHFRRAALNGYLSGSIELARSLRDSGGSSEDIKEAFRIVNEASDAGNVDAHMLLADSYEEGVEDADILIDAVEEAGYYRLAADMENHVAQNTLGVYYLSGHGVEFDVEEGLRLIRKSARAGDAYALCNLGEFHVYGYGEHVLLNIRKGLHYLERASRKNHDNASFHLGKLYKRGKEVRHDAITACSFFYLADGPSHTDATVQYGLCLRDGFGTERDSQYAAETFRRAADLGNKQGKLLLGLCYRAGEGVEKSDASAMGLFRQAV